MADPASNHGLPTARLRADIHTIPVHRAFADALAAGIVQRVGATSLDLAAGMIILPNNRAVTALRDAFVRLRGQATLLPRLVALGESDLDASAGAALDRLGDDAAAVPPVISTARRRFLLASLIARDRPGIPAGEAMRLADSLASVLDQLAIEEVPLTALEALRDDDIVARHWEEAFASLQMLVRRWPTLLKDLGLIGRTDQRNLLLDRTARTWATMGLPVPYVIAAGISTSAPAVARLLRVIAFADGGTVVLPHLDLAMGADDWARLGEDPRKAAQSDAPDAAVKALETHPQFHLKLLLDRMGIARDEVMAWPDTGAMDGPPHRVTMIHHLLAPARRTGDWAGLKPSERRMDGLATLDAATLAEEAQVIALAMREALETPGRTAALVTPDRAIAARVAGHLARWGIVADDSAGTPLSATPPGALLLLLASAIDNGFAPTDIVALLSHPLVRAEDEAGRRAWLDQVRDLDLALRGPRPGPGLAGIAAALADKSGVKDRLAALRAWWANVSAALAPLESDDATLSLADLLLRLRTVASALAGDALWSGAAGRALSGLFDETESVAADYIPNVAPRDAAPVLRLLMADVAVRPPQGGHPRLFIWGLLEARLQRADRMILAGLNEGQWPQPPTPDPWLAPLLRRRLGLPGMDRQTGLAAHDFASALGASDVLLVRSQRDAAAPTVASRLRLRLDALSGEAASLREPAAPLLAVARALDGCASPQPVSRPAPAPPLDRRPTRVSVTEVDRLIADPFAFYARAGLGLMPLDPLDAPSTAAWRGTALHDVLEIWLRKSDQSIDALDTLTDAMLAQPHVGPRQRILWGPRLRQALHWAAGEVLAGMAAGREPIIAASETKQSVSLGKVQLIGKPDRIDRLADGSLAIVDYKSGGSPSKRQVAAKFALQLGLLGAMAEQGAFTRTGESVTAFEYWRLNRAPSGQRKGEMGWIDAPFLSKPPEDVAHVTAETFASDAWQRFEDAVDDWLYGHRPFVARLSPEWASYGDYDQLMRLEEWYGREGGDTLENAL